MFLILSQNFYWPLPVFQVLGYTVDKADKDPLLSEIICSGNLNKCVANGQAQYDKTELHNKC